ncbi:CBS domain-containing protein [Levilactobacillus tongjiangensis]|uniref:CBS domain-containing protein n=1 Tax=Levilactobacillus tongjiangensis TaxID=2486023 RepID=A0ABW1SQ88_9LACO|nr:CBS domain-containing protein [Levilactobacillus tongjiangensis]
MSVADYMTQQLVVVSPQMTVSGAVELMKQNQIHRLPVMDGETMVGLITQGIISRALPSQATSLSVYETNYLLTKTTVADIMEKNVQTIPAGAQLEDAIYQMREHKISVLPVMANDRVVGIITNNDILDAFLNISGYGEPGVVSRIRVAHDHTGVIFKVGQVLADHDLSIQTLMVVRENQERVIELHIANDQAADVNQILAEAGFDVV